MESVQSRANNLLSHLTLVLSFVGVLVWLTNFYLKKDIFDGSFNINSVHLNQGNIGTYLNMEAAHFTLSLNANLTKNFHWNCKQVNLQIIAFYKSKKNKRNQVLIYDKIIRNHENHIIIKNDIDADYYLLDDGYYLRNNIIEFELRVELIPNIGFISAFSYPQKIKRKMPNDYKTVIFD